MSTTTTVPAWQIALDESTAKKAEANRTFWQLVKDGLAAIEATKPTTFDGVRDILNAHADGYHHQPSTNPDAAFFPGGGGEDTLRDALRAAGWRVLWSEASYHYVAHHPVSGDWLHYVEGDVVRTDRERLLALAERMEAEGR